MPVPKRFHAGEVAAQEARGFADDLWGADPPYEEGLAPFYAQFFSQLDFLPLSSMDEKGRPWASLVSGNDGQIGFLKAIQQDDWTKSTLKFEVSQARCLPLLRTLQNGKEVEQDDEQRKISASVGIMIHNRRRNKMDCWFKGLEKKGDNIEIELGVSYTMGNCPKYINRRIFAPSELSPKLLSTSLPKTAVGQRLPDMALEVVSQADIIYLATRHTGDPSAYPPDRNLMGMNNRGGRRGFVRHFFDEEKQMSCLVIPDFSGNRFLQSIGNLMSDHVAGLAFPYWGFKPPSGQIVRQTRVLYVTGPTELLVGQEAKKLMRGVEACIKVWVEDFELNEGDLPLVIDGTRPLGPNAADVSPEELTEDQCIDWSPYNPPIRYLNSEIPPTINSQDNAVAVLEDVDFWTPLLATFHWSCDASLGNYEAGQFVIMDCSDLLETRLKLYSHMASFRGGERELNDDGVRSWTISSRPRLSDDGKRLLFKTTIRRKQRGAATPGLFHQGRMLKVWELASKNGDAGTKPNITLPLLGFDGSFTLSAVPKRAPHDGEVDSTRRLLYLCQGIGITPILSNIEELASGSVQGRTEATIVVAARETETDLLASLVRRAAEGVDPSKVTLRLILIARPAEEEDAIFTNISDDMLSAISDGDVQINTTKLTGARIDNNFFSPDLFAPEAAVASTAIFICGTQAFENACRQAMKLAITKVGNAASSQPIIISESFSF